MVAETIPAINTYFECIKTLPLYTPEQELVAARHLDDLRTRLFYAPFREIPSAAYSFIYKIERDIRLRRRRLYNVFDIPEEDTTLETAHDIENSRQRKDRIEQVHQKKCAEVKKIVDRLHKIESRVYSMGRYTLEAPKYIQRGIEIVQSLKLRNDVLLECARYVSEQSASKKAREILQKYRREYESQFNDIIQHNLRLVIPLARRALSSNTGNLSFDDLIQEGNIGLMRAVEEYDWKRGYRFSTYATWWIKQNMYRAISNTSSTVRIPIHMKDRFFRIYRTEKELTQRLGRMPTIAETALESGVPEELVVMSRRNTMPILSLDHAQEDNRVPYEAIEDITVVMPINEVFNSELSRQIARLLTCLSRREEDILRKRFGIDNDITHTLKEIGERYNFTRERIRQIQNLALRKLKKRALKKDLESYLK